MTINMFGLFKRKREVTPHNVYAVLNEELLRLHDNMLTSIKCSSHAAESNAQTYWRRIGKLHEALIKALEQQPSHDESIKDLQDTVSELIMLGDMSEHQ